MKDDLWRGRATCANVGKCSGTIGKGACLCPVERAKATIKDRLRRIPEVLHRVGIGADKRYFLQRHTADIEATSVFTEPDMSNHSTGSRMGRSGGSRAGIANPVNHDVEHHLWFQVIG